MRLNKLNQLIHSSKHSSASRAAVEVSFKKIIVFGNDLVSEVPEGAFTLRRTVLNSGISKYEINNR